MPVRPNLARATSKIESLMQDTCQIVRDAEGVGDDVWDEETGQFIAPTNDTITVYSGPCFVRPTGIGSTESAEMTATSNPGYRTLAGYIPKNITGVAENDWMVITSSLRDPLLVGRRLRVIGIRHMTFAVARILDLEDVR